jgi:hypothetical protein
MPLNALLSRLPIIGAAVASTGTADAGKVPVLGNDGKLDPSLLPSDYAGGGLGAFPKGDYDYVEMTQFAGAQQPGLITFYKNDTPVAQVAVTWSDTLPTQVVTTENDIVVTYTLAYDTDKNLVNMSKS